MVHLVALSGLPGVGKTTIARALAGAIGGAHLRIDSLETALKRSSLRIDPAEDAGYVAAAAIARDNLGIGLDVVADAVNPVHQSRQLWADTAAATGAVLLNVEIVCSDPGEHRRRVEARRSDLPGLEVPDWGAVCSRHYEAWESEPVTLDTAHLTVEACVAALRDAMGHRG